jgi:hypothetical protein
MVLVFGQKISLEDPRAYLSGILTFTVTYNTNYVIMTTLKALIVCFRVFLLNEVKLLVRRHSFCDVCVCSGA